MNNSPSPNVLSRAIAVASASHLMQLDKQGVPYILHPLRMMMRLRTTDQELMAIAVLHDVVEDCKVSYSELEAMGMTPRIIEGVKLLTRQPGDTYEQFIQRLAGNKDALLVKREDLRDNSDITRLKGITSKDFERVQRYMQALQRVEAMLKDLETLSK